ncbi:MAG: ABC transporter permease [Candidatus Angelobacter sp.]
MIVILEGCSSGTVELRQGWKRVKDRTRHEYRSTFLEDLLRDLRFGMRALGRAPAFTLVCGLMLTLGIGATTAIFSVVNGVVLKPLPYQDANSLISLKHAAPGVTALSDDLGMSGALLSTYRSQNQTFQEIGIWGKGTETVAGGGEPEEVESLYVSDGTLRALGVQPAIGRWFSQTDDTVDSPETVILTYGYWQHRYGGASSVIGQPIMIDSRPRTVIGVMPNGFRFLNAEPRLILPLRFKEGELHLGGFAYQGLVRLKPGVTIDQATADIARMIPIWLNTWRPPPGQDRQFFASMRLTPALRPLKQDVIGNIGKVLWVLLGMIGVVLLIACANVANLLLVRAEERQHELSIRVALGAGMGRIARAMLVESLVLGLFGGALGLGVAFVAVRVFVSIGPTILPRLQDITIDPSVAVFALGISLLSGLVFGLIPVIKHAGPQIAVALRAGGRTSSDGRERHRVRNILVVVQVALAVVLLVSSGLMIRTFLVVRAVQLGFADPDHVQLVRVFIPPAEAPDPERVVRMQADMRDRLAAIPDVTSASFTSAAPMGTSTGDVILDDDNIYKRMPVQPVRQFKFVAPSFFQTIGTPIVAGRDFTWADLYDHRPVTVISENLAREMWRQPAAALGKHIRESSSAWREIVGVVGDVHDNGADQASPTTVYWPALMENFWGEHIQIERGMTFVIHSRRAGTSAFLEQIRSAIWAVGSNIPLGQVRTLGDMYQASLARLSFTLVMLGIAAGMALLIGLVGLYGVIAYTVSQRRREIGIRVALGASREELRYMFVRHGMALAAVGVVCGLVCAVVLTRLMTSLLFGVSPLDPATYAVVSLGLIAAAALASYVPARRATLVDPIEALRTD